MYKALLFIFCFATVVMLPQKGIAQEKIEREYKVKKVEVPQRALEFILEMETLSPKTKVNWYREEDAEDESYEAKFKHEKRSYSIEFSKNGELEDAEIEVDKSEIPQAILESVERELNEAFSKWNIKKVQLQWVGEESLVISSIDQKSRQEGVEENYEIVIKGQTENSKSYYEILFDAEGNLLRKSRIRQNSFDILIY